MMFLFRYFEKKDKLLLFLTYSITLVWVLINSSQWFLIAELTDIFFKIQEYGHTLTYQETVHYALALFGFIIACNVVGFSLKFFTRSMAVKVSLTLSFRVRNKLFYSFLLMKENEINDIGTSSLNNRLTNDLNELQNCIINLLTFGIERVLIVLFCIIYSLILSPILSVVYPVIILIILIFGIISTKRSFHNYSEANKALDGTNKVMKENIVGNKIIRIFGLVNHQSKRFEQYNNTWYKYILKGESFIYVTFVFILFIINSLTIFLLIVGGTINYNIYFFGNNFPIKAISIGVIVAFINYLWETIFAISGMLEVYVSFVRVRPILKRLKFIFDSQKESIDNKKTIDIKDYEINFKNVFFKYGDDKEYILKNINLKLEKNKIYGLIGPTGSGKTTLINLICKLYDANLGDIKIGDYKYSEINDTSIRNNISIAFQEKLIYEGTFKKNLLMGKNDASEKEIIKALKQSQAYEYIMKFDDTIEHYVSERGNNLSGGQKQRLSLARAFIKNSNILILDDSLSALDNITRNKIIETLKKDFKDKTIIISGQQIKTISFADEIIVFDKGEIKSKGKHKELLKKCDLYKKIYDSQKTIGE